MTNPQNVVNPCPRIRGNISYFNFVSCFIALHVSPHYIFHSNARFVPLQVSCHYKFHFITSFNPLHISLHHTFHCLSASFHYTFLCIKCFTALNVSFHYSFIPSSVCEHVPVCLWRVGLPFTLIDSVWREKWGLEWGLMTRSYRWIRVRIGTRGCCVRSEQLAKYRLRRLLSVKRYDILIKKKKHTTCTNRRQPSMRWITSRDVQRACQNAQ